MRASPSSWWPYQRRLASGLTGHHQVFRPLRHHYVERGPARQVCVIAYSDDAVRTPGAGVHFVYNGAGNRGLQGTDYECAYAFTVPQLPFGAILPRALSRTRDCGCVSASAGAGL